MDERRVRAEHHTDQDQLAFDQLAYLAATGIAEHIDCRIGDRLLGTDEGVQAQAFRAQ